jgi:hypothetical protein
MKTWRGYLGLLHVITLAVVLGGVTLSPKGCPAPPVPWGFIAVFAVWIGTGAALAAHSIKHDG